MSNNTSDHNSNFIPDKPFKTYDEQLQILRNRNLIIDDIKSAKHFLQIYSYYDLINGSNINHFLKSRHPIIYKDGITLSYLAKVRLIEEQFKQVLLSQILNIEKKFKTQLSYYISDNFGVDSSDRGYLKSSNYSDINSQRRNTLRKFRNIRDLNHHRPPSRSLLYYKNHHNHIPPWILINESMFGESIYLYKILSNEGKRYMTDSMLSYSCDMELKLDMMTSLLSILRECRNSFAHNTVLSKISTTYSLQVIKVEEMINNSLVFNHASFPSLNLNNILGCIISILLMSDDYDQLSIFLSRMNEIYRLDKDIFKNVFELPDNFISLSENIVKDKFHLN